MKAKTGMRSFSMLLALLLVSVGLVPAAAATSEVTQDAPDERRGSSHYLVYDHRYTFGTDPDVRLITEDRLLDTAKYTLGLVKYMRD